MIEPKCDSKLLKDLIRKASPTELNLDYAVGVKKILCTSIGIKQITLGLTSLIKDYRGNVLIGVGYYGILLVPTLAVAVSLEQGWRVGFSRKEGSIEGNIKFNDYAIIVDDVVRTGETMKKVEKWCKDEWGMKVIAQVAILDYLDRPEPGNILSLFTLDDFE